MPPMNAPSHRPGPRVPALLALLLALGLAPFGPAHAQSGPAAPSGGAAIVPHPHPAHASDALFTGPVQLFEITLRPAELDSLRREPRKSVPGTLKCGSNSWESVGFRIKGAAGSTRDIDDLPALTLNVDKFKSGQKVFGLDKLHLNNSVQDPSRMSEIVCSDLYRRAGIPAARATHALVRLNGRDLGLYVLKEGFDRSFLNREFRDASGNLYDGGFLRDVDQQLELDSGKEPPDWKDLRALDAACQIPDARQRKARLAALVDIDRFLTYTALQVMTEDWDGYPCNRNNYRLYNDPASGKFVFLPHGMDQMFSQGGMPLNRGFQGTVAVAVFQDPGWRSAYYDRVAHLLEGVFTTNAILKTFDEAVARREPALARLHRGDAGSIRAASRDLRGSILSRIAGLREQIASRPTPAVIGADGSVKLGAWAPRVGDGPGRAGQVKDASGAEQLQLILDGEGLASWRMKLFVPAGRYVFEARGRTKGLVAESNERGTGLGIRISGTRRTQQLTGTTDWQPLRFEFEADSEREIELVAEMRGTRGTGWFDPAAFRLRRVSQ